MSAPVVDAPPRLVGLLLRVAVPVAFAAAVAGTFTSGRISRTFGGVAVGVVVAAPLLRVAVLGAHWARRSDVRFAVAAAGLLVVAGSGALLALL